MSENSLILKNEDGSPFEVPVDGSLGLLALGYVGLMAWREKRHSEGYDLVGIKKQEWEAITAKWEEKKKFLEQKRKEFLERKEGEKKGKK